MAALSTIATRSDYNQGTADGITGAIESDAPQTYACACGKTFKRRAPYERHCEIAHSSTTTSHKCSRCGKTFGNENTLTMHMSVHENKAAFGQLVTGDASWSNNKRNTEKEAANSDKENIGDSESSYSPCSNSGSVSDVLAQTTESKPYPTDQEDANLQYPSLPASANIEQKDLLPPPLVNSQGQVVLADAPDMVAMQQVIGSRGAAEPLHTMPSDIASAHPSLAGRLSTSHHPGGSSSHHALLPNGGHPAPLAVDFHHHPASHPVSLAEPLPTSGPPPPGVTRDCPAMAPPGGATIVHTFAPMTSHSNMMTSQNSPIAHLNSPVSVTTRSPPHLAPMTTSPHPFSTVAGPLSSQSEPVFNIRPPSLPSELPQLQSPPPFHHLSPLPKGIHIKKEIIDDEVTFSEETARMMRGLTQEELAMVENFRDLQDNFRDLEDIDEAEIKREIEESDMTEAEKQVLRKSCRRRQANPIWKSLLTGKMYDKALEHLDKKAYAAAQENERAALMDTSELISVSMETLKSDVGDVFCDDSLAYVPPDALKKAKRSRKGKGSVQSNTFECYVCGKVFISEKYLSMHISLHGTVKTEVDEVSEEAQLDEYMQQCTEEPLSPSMTSQGEVSMDNGPPKKMVRKVSKGGEGGWTCSLCSKTFAHNSGYKNHMRTHSNERPYVCSICDIGFKEKYHLKKHNLFIHSTELPEKCRVCGKRFKDSTAVRAHERIHSDARPFGCRRCGKSFKTSECLWHHEHRSKTCGQTYGEPQPVDKGPRKRRKFPKTDPLEHLAVEHKLEEYHPQTPPTTPEIKLEPMPEPCERYMPVCPVPSPMQQQPHRHSPPVQQLHHSPPPGCNGTSPDLHYDLSSIPTLVQNLEADACGEEFPDDLLDPDMCQDRRQLCCVICSKAFGDQASFARHAKVHTEERPFVCTKCDIGFKMKVHLKKHVLYVHSDDYPCECQFCGKRFKDSSAVKLHERTHSDSRPFQCTGCGKAFKTRENLWGHQHRGKCLQGPPRMGDNVYGPGPNGHGDGSPTEHLHAQQRCAQASVDNNGVTAHASVSNSIYAQAYVSTSQVTARAIIENNQVTAHASFANNHVTAHASLVNNQVTAHAVINDAVSAQATVGADGYKGPKYGCTSSPTPGTVPTSAMNGVHMSAAQTGGMPSPQHAPQYSPPAKDASVQYLHPKVTEVLQKAPLLPPAQVVNLGAGANVSPPAVPTHVAPSQPGSPMTSPTAQQGSPNGKWPTLKEFLQRGVESLKAPIVQPGPATWFDPTTGQPLVQPQTCSPPLTPTAKMTPSTEYPTIKERLMRGFSKGLTPGSPTVTYTPPGAPVPFLGGPAGSGGAIPSFQSTFLSKQPPPLTPLSSPSPLIRSEDPSIPIIYWDEDTDSRAPPSVHSWNSDSEAMLQDIQETVLTQL